MIEKKERTALLSNNSRISRANYFNLYWMRGRGEKYGPAPTGCKLESNASKDLSSRLVVDVLMDHCSSFCIYTAISVIHFAMFQLYIHQLHVDDCIAASTMVKGPLMWKLSISTSVWCVLYVKTQHFHFSFMCHLRWKLSVSTSVWCIL